MAVVETLVARLEADTGQFAAGMSRASDTMGRMNMAVTGSSRGLTVLRSGLLTLASEATGTVGPVSKLTQGLLLLAGGSTFVLGVAAGIAVIAAGYNAITKAAKDATEQQHRLVEALADVAAQKSPAAARLGEAVKELDDAQQRLSKMEARLELVRQGRLVGLPGEEENAQVARDAVTTAEKLVELRRSELRVWRDGIVVEHIKAEQAELRRVERLKEGLSVMMRQKQEMQDYFTTLKSEIAIERGMKKHPFDPTGESAKGAAFANQLEKVRLKEFLPPDDQIRGLGMDIGHILASGIADGFQDMQSVLRSVFSAVLNFALSAYLNTLLPGAGTAVGASRSAGSMGDIGGGAIQPSQISPASFALQTAGALSAPTTPFAVMRDAEWQRYLRGSLIVARKDGFRP